MKDEVKAVRASSFNEVTADFRQPSLHPSSLSLLFGAECFRDYIRFGNGKASRENPCRPSQVLFFERGECGCEYMESLAAGRRFEPYNARRNGRVNLTPTLSPLNFLTFGVNAGRTTSSNKR